MPWKPPVTVLVVALSLPTLAGEAKIRFSAEHGLSEEDADTLEDQAFDQAIELGRFLDETIDSYCYALDAYKRVDATAKDSLSRNEYLRQWTKAADLLFYGFGRAFPAKEIDEWIELVANRYQLPIGKVANIGNVILVLKQRSSVSLPDLKRLSEKCIDVLMGQEIRPGNRIDALGQLLAFSVSVEHEHKGTGDNVLDLYANFLNPLNREMLALWPKFGISRALAKRAREGDKASMDEVQNRIMRGIAQLYDAATQ